MQRYLVFLLFLATHSFALQPLEGAELAYSTSASQLAPASPSVIPYTYRSLETLDKNENISESQIRFKVEIKKLTSKIQTIYKDQLKIQNIPSQCIRFQFQMNKDGSVKGIEANKDDMMSENKVLISALLKMFKESTFHSESDDYSTFYKFCFHP